MKNFLISLVIFFVCSTLGLWIYTSYPNVFDITNTTAKVENNSFYPNRTISEDVIKEPNDANQQSEDDLFPDIEEVTSRNVIKNIAHPDITKTSYVYGTEGTILHSLKNGITSISDEANVYLPDNSEGFFIYLATYLEKYQDINICIVSYYHPSENIEIPNLAEQRGQLIVSKLVEQEVDPERILIKTKLDTWPLDSNNELQKKIAFQFIAANTSVNALLENENNSIIIENGESELIIKENQFEENNDDEERFIQTTTTSGIPGKIIFYPRCNYQKITIDDDFENLLQHVNQLLDTNLDLMIEIVAHTNEAVDKAMNYRLALEKSKQVKWHFITKTNIDPSKIKAISKGDTAPIYEDNLENIKKNSRLEIIFKKDLN